MSCRTKGYNHTQKSIAALSLIAGGIVVRKIPIAVNRYREIRCNLNLEAR